MKSKGVGDITIDTVKGLLIPRVFFFTLAFAGFWLMFYQLFDILPNYIDDWIDSRALRAGLVSLTWEGAIPEVNGGNMTQEWMININALLISLFAFLVGYLTGRMRSLVAIVVGIAISGVAIYALGLSMNGWVIAGAIALFSVGEMLASPTKMRYFASIAPPGKEGQYMGYVNFTVGIGWSIGSVVAGHWYEESGDKINLARRHLVEQGELSASAAAELDRGDVMGVFERAFDVDAWGARELLFNTYEPHAMWPLFTAIGGFSLVLLLAYDLVTRKASADPKHSFNTHGQWWVRAALVPIVGAFAYSTANHFTGAVLVLTIMFALLLGASFVIRPDPEVPQAPKDAEEDRAAS